MNTHTHSISQPHDRFLKALLSQPETAATFLQERLPKDLVALLRTETVQLTQDSFVDEALRAHFSDRVLQVQMVDDATAFLYTLIEHKSRPDYWTPLQLLTYLVRMLNKLQEQGWNPLPPVISVLIYHGTDPWNMPQEFLALVDANEVLRPYLMNFRIVTVDLGPIPDDEMSHNARLRAGLLALKYSNRPLEQLQILNRIALELVDVSEEFFMQILIYIIHTYVTANETVIRTIIQKARPTEETKMMSIFAQEMIAKGRQEGLQEGVQEGEQKATANILQRQLTRRMQGFLPEWVHEKIKSADLKTLELWTDLVLDARSLQDVFGSDLPAMPEKKSSKPDHRRKPK
ncbi:MAG: Rpn family recombination-promoting nuclease/putative transposase [Magnetococcus sp. YQC-5]